MTELGASHVNVESSNGVTTLRGTVPYPDFRGAAEQLAREGGAQIVIDELTVAPSAQGQPDPYLQGIPGVTTSEGATVVETRVTLAQRVREALEDDPRINANVMTVRVDDRVAYLTGRQGTTDASEAATEVAAHVPGIVAVSNDIEIIANA
jgi:osmotically-inducible protein OsmY